MSQRYRFSVVVNELKATENIPYLTGVMSFINATILSTENLHDRMHLRNEFIGKSQLCLGMSQYNITVRKWCTYTGILNPFTYELLVSSDHMFTYYFL